MGCGNGKEEDETEEQKAASNHPAAAEGPMRPLPMKDVQKGGISLSQFVVNRAGAITDVYDIDKKRLGEGSYGTVCQAKNKIHKITRAIKSISKSQVKNIFRFRQEIAIMKMMDHPNIIRLYESFEDRKNIYLVLELALGGEMFDRIVESGKFTEVQAAILMKQIFRAIYYMHENHVCHRDLKPENFLFMEKGPVDQTTLKIIDFGLSCPFKDGEMLSTKAGTPYYVAPEVLAGNYNQMSDLWSAGVILYVLLCGYPPFFGNNDAEVLSKVKTGKVTFHKKAWEQKSQGSKDLIGGLLQKDYNERFTAGRALHDVWIEKQAPKAKGIEAAPDLILNLRQFMNTNKLKKAAIHIIASQLPEKDIKNLRDLFTDLDDNGDGLLTRQELRDGLQRVMIKDVPQDLQEIITSIDCDGSGVIDYTEFLAAAIDKRVLIQEDVCWQAFRVLDKDGNGKVSKQELKNILNDEDVQDVAEEGSFVRVMAEADRDHDGQIDFEEFMAMMRNADRLQ